MNRCSNQRIKRRFSLMIDRLLLWKKVSQGGQSLTALLKESIVVKGNPWIVSIDGRARKGREREREREMWEIIERRWENILSDWSRKNENRFSIRFNRKNLTQRKRERSRYRRLKIIDEGILFTRKIIRDGNQSNIGWWWWRKEDDSARISIPTNLHLCVPQRIRQFASS